MQSKLLQDSSLETSYQETTRASTIRESMLARGWSVKLAGEALSRKYIRPLIRKKLWIAMLEDT